MALACTEMGGGAPAFQRPARVWRAPLVIAAVAAFLFQLVLGDAHWHWPTAIQLTSVAGTVGNAAPEADHGHQKAQTCLICQSLAAGSRTVILGAALSVAPVAVVRAETIVDRQRLMPIQRSHNWRGRGPPATAL